MRSPGNPAKMGRNLLISSVKGDEVLYFKMAGRGNSKSDPRMYTSASCMNL